MLRLKTREDARNTLLLCQCRIDLRGHQAHLGTGIEQHARLALGDVTAADYQASLAFGVYEDWQKIHTYLTAFKISGTSASGNAILPASAKSCARGDIFCQVFLMIWIHFSSSYSGCCVAKPIM